MLRFAHIRMHRKFITCVVWMLTHHWHPGTELHFFLRNISEHSVLRYNTIYSGWRQYWSVWLKSNPQPESFLQKRLQSKLSSASTAQILQQHHVQEMKNWRSQKEKDNIIHALYKWMQIFILTPIPFHQHASKPLTPTPISNASSQVISN